MSTTGTKKGAEAPILVASDLAVDLETIRGFHETVVPKLAAVELPPEYAGDRRPCESIPAPVGSVDMITGPTGVALGQRSIIFGTVYDETGAPFPHVLMEIWQVNSAGSYNNVLDDFGAPLDPNFLGAARVITDSEGKFRITTVKPAPYGKDIAWRRAHIHFSLTSSDMKTRVVTQMYFPGDPVGDFDPCTTNLPEDGIQLLIGKYDRQATGENSAVSYHWDIYLPGLAKNA